MTNKSDCLSLKEFCSSLEISEMTGRNWLKLGKITPSYIYDDLPYFSKEYTKSLIKDLQSGINDSLKSRRNKKYITGSSLYHSYVSPDCKNTVKIQELLDAALNAGINIDNNVIKYIIADCALHLYVTKDKKKPDSSSQLLKKFLLNEISVNDYSRLITPFISDIQSALSFCDTYPLLFEVSYFYEENEDILGLLYLSMKNIGNRKHTGAYYTPTSIVKKLIASLDISTKDLLLDPCCGTGNFLMQLPKTLPFTNIYGNDIDEISVMITRINMFLKYTTADITAIENHITQFNFFTDYEKKDFRFIIGNPPWGYSFSLKEHNKLKACYKTAEGKNIESYDVTLECALKHLATNGTLSFILPEAVLNVKAHYKIREQILDSASISYLEYLGNVFDGVQCPCIILSLIKTGKPFSTLGMKVRYHNRLTDINTSRTVIPDYLSFIANNEEYEVLKKIKKTKAVKFLKNNADFALGIVTGNNKKLIAHEKNENNELIIKGSDLVKYNIRLGNNYIEYTPDAFQQVAPSSMYKAKEKLFYKFISNRLVFAYDNNQLLSLNSCNILIPKIEGLDIKYVLAILNSSVADYYYKMEFNSVKVLRSHIESIPIPVADDSTQKKIIDMVDYLLTNKAASINEKKAAYEQLDSLIFRLYSLTAYDIGIIKEAISLPDL